MPSEARQTFEENCSEVERLLEIHSLVTPSGPGRKHKVEVLNRSAILMTCAFWEAYVEDACTEVVEHVVAQASGPVTLPLSLRKTIAAQLKNDKNELAVWRLAEGGWRSVVQTNLANLTKQRNFSFMSPKAAPIDDLFETALGIQGISDEWKRQGIDSAACRTRLDTYVTLRGDIAHRGRVATRTVRKKDCREFLVHVKALAKCMEATLLDYCSQVGAPPLFSD